jgi:hypothetical protein
MRRIRRLLRETTIGMLLIAILQFPATLPLSQQIALTVGITGITVVAGSQTACGPDTLEKLNTTLNHTAHALEAAIDTNGRLYESGSYGAKGSEQAIAIRQRVARVIHDSNEYLIQAVDIAKTLTKETFENGKVAILEKLSLAAQGLRIGHPTIDLVLQSVAALINQAVALTQLFKASDVNHMDRIVPALNRHLSNFARIRASTVPELEVFAE